MMGNTVTITLEEYLKLKEGVPDNYVTLELYEFLDLRDDSNKFHKLVADMLELAYVWKYGETPMLGWHTADINRLFKACAPFQYERKVEELAEEKKGKE